MAFGASLVRRSVEIAHAATSSSLPEGQHPKMPKVSTWACFLVLVTILGSCALLFVVQYSYGLVVGALTMIESNQSDAYVAVDTLRPNDDGDGTNKPPTSETLVEPEILLMKNTPITTSIRRTIKHLRANYGYLSRFRGLSLFICLCIARFFIIQFFSIVPFMENWIGSCIASILADLVLARWELTWIHIVISEPTQSKWWRRAPPLNSWVKIAPAVLLKSVAGFVRRIVPVMVALNFGVLKRMRSPGFEPSRSEIDAACAQSLPILLLTIALFVLIQLPATVILVRVAASMLPEENETVVPFDRSFGGKVTPAIIGGQGKIGMVEAWKSFDWSSRVRLVKLMAKIFVIMLGACTFLIIVSVCEAHLIVGSKDLKAIVGVIAGRTGQH